MEANGTYVPTGDIDKDTKGNRWKASLYTSRAPLYLLKWISADPQLARSLANYSSRPRLAVGCTDGSAQCGGGLGAVASGVDASGHTSAGLLLLKLVGILCFVGLFL